MTYLERKFLRDLLIGLASAEAAIVVILAVLHLFRSHARPELPETISLSTALAAGAFPTGLMAMALGAAFSRLNVIIDLMWTRPVSRLRIALSIIGLHLGALSIAWAIGFALLGIAPMVLFGGVPFSSLVFDAQAAQTAWALLASLLGIYGLVIVTLFAQRSQSKLNAPFVALFFGMVAGGVALLVIMPIGSAGIPAITIAFGGPVSMAKAAAALRAAQGLEPFWPANLFTYTLVWFAIAIAGIGTTSYNWRRLQF